MRLPMQLMAAAVSFCIMTSCRPMPHGDYAVDVDASEWNAGEVFGVVYTNSDTTGLRNISLLTRVEHDFRGENGTLPLTVTCTAPDGSSHTFDCVITPNKTNNRSVSMVDSKSPFIEKAVLSQSGDYRFDFTPRSECPLCGVWSVGIEIE